MAQHLLAVTAVQELQVQLLVQPYYMLEVVADRVILLVVERPARVLLAVVTAVQEVVTEQMRQRIVVQAVVVEPVQLVVDQQVMVVVVDRE